MSAKQTTSTISGESIIKTLKHEIGNILKGPAGLLELFPKFLERNQISVESPSSTYAQAQSIGDRIQSAKEDINRVYEMMEDMEGILLAESAALRIEKTELVSFIRAKVEHLRGPESFDFIIGTNNNYLTPGRMFAVIDKRQFEHLISNIVLNALRHGNKINERLNIVIHLVSIKDSQEIEIHFMNDGDKLPSDLTLETYVGFALKSGNSNGQGIGGYLIHKIVMNHKGQIELLPPSSLTITTKDGILDFKSNVEILITIPINQ